MKGIAENVISDLQKLYSLSKADLYEKVKGNFAQLAELPKIFYKLITELLAEIKIMGDFFTECSKNFESYVEKSKKARGTKSAKQAYEKVFKQLPS